MRGVDENRWGTAQPLQPAGTGDSGETCPHRVDIQLPLRARAEERLDRGQRHHRVVRLMFAVQRQEDLAIRPAEALQFEQLSSDGGLPAEHGEFRILAGYRGVGAHRLCQENLHRFWQLTADHRNGAQICARRHGLVACFLMTPAFSPAISAMVSPR